MTTVQTTELTIQERIEKIVELAGNDIALCINVLINSDGMVITPRPESMKGFALHNIDATAYDSIHPKRTGFPESVPASRHEYLYSVGNTFTRVNDFMVHSTENITFLGCNGE